MVLRHHLAAPCATRTPWTTCLSRSLNIAASQKVNASQDLGRSVSTATSHKMTVTHDLASRPSTADSPISGVAFSVQHQKGSLLKALSVFDKAGMNMTRIESKVSPLNPRRQMMYIHFEGEFGDDKSQQLLRMLKEHSGSDGIVEGSIKRLRTNESPWFPRQMADIDSFSKSTLDAGTELTSDHPGFTDPEYRRRREEIVQKAATYQTGLPIPTIEYTKEENQTWATVYKRLRELFPEHACSEYQEALKGLEATGLYGKDAIPQQKDVSDFLKSRTGFVLRPVTGLLSGRDFLNALAFRVFFSTQYIRHGSTPLYTPEPDVCHELIGHAPMFANQEFADFSQVIGLASLGASDDDIKRLASCYWFSVEFGLLKQDNKLKAYGAGLLSGFGELEYACGVSTPKPGKDVAKPRILPWDPDVACKTEYPITEYQPLYFAANSLHDAKELMLQFCQSLRKPFSVTYDPASETVRTNTDVQPTRKTTACRGAY